MKMNFLVNYLINRIRVGNQMGMLVIEVVLGIFWGGGESDLLKLLVFKTVVVLVKFDVIVQNK